MQRARGVFVGRALPRGESFLDAVHRVNEFLPHLKRQDGALLWRIALPGTRWSTCPKGGALREIVSDYQASTVTAGAMDNSLSSKL
jgi:hypothetical protein